MAPDVLHTVWAELQARIDICSVVREILGHFEIKAIGEAPSASDSFNFIVWMKVIYDLQRTYLQSSDPSPETLSYLLPPQILFKTLRRVLDIKPRLRPAESQTYPTQQPRFFAAQAILSGVRALILRGVSENSPDVEELHAIEILIQKWIEECDGGPEKFMLNQCHNGLVLLRRGPEPSSVWNKPACNVCELRDNAIDLYPAITKRMMSKLTTQLSQETSSLDPQDHFWARFDIIWAVEAGYIQWCSDKLLGRYVIDDKCEVGSLVKILEEITPDWCSMSVLNHTWHNRKHGPIHTERVGVDPDLLQADIDEALEDFRSFLKTRREKLVDYNSEIRKLSTALGQDIESWMRRASAYGRYVDLRGSEQPLKTALILGCPMLHVVPEHQLKSLVQESYSNNDKIFLGNPELLDLTETPIYCPRCSSRQSTTVIKHARRVDPLNTTSNRLEHLVETSITTQDSDTSQQLKGWRENQVRWPSAKPQRVDSVPTQDNIINDLPSPLSPPNSQLSSPSSSINDVKRVTSNKSEESKSTKTTGTSRFSNIFRRKSSVPPNIVLGTTQATQRHLFNSYCFSSNGKMLILWNNRANHIYCSVVPAPEDPELETSWDWMKFGNGLGSVELVASGATRIAMISKEEKRSRLLVFGVSKPPNLEPILEKVLPRDKKLINKSLSMSPDGGLVAVGTDKEVLVYHIDDFINNAELSPKILKLSGIFSGMDVFSQCMNFSQDCKKLVIATRYYNDGNCEIEILLYELPSGQELPGIKTKPHLFTSTDNGLTAVFYDHRKKEIILTGSINKSYGNVYSSRRNSRPIYWPPESSKIQAAVACPSESQYVFLGSTGGLYSVDLDEERSRKRPSRFGWENKYSVPETPTRSESSTSFVALAAPDVDRIYTFRIEKEEMILELIRGKGIPDRIGFVGPPPIDI